jgi:hypothetical protein
MKTFNSFRVGLSRTEIWYKLCAMPTLDERFHVFHFSAIRRLRRDVRLVRFLAAMAWQWIVAGGCVRRAYGRAVRTGATLYVDALGGRGKYD